MINMTTRIAAVLWASSRGPDAADMGMHCKPRGTHRWSSAPLAAAIASLHFIILCLSQVRQSKGNHGVPLSPQDNRLRADIGLPLLVSNGAVPRFSLADEIRTPFLRTNRTMDRRTNCHA